MNQLPRGWTFAKFGDVFDFKGGSQPPKEEFLSEPRDGYVRLLQIRDFEDDSKAVYISDQKKWPKCAEHDIMIGRYGASVGKVLGGKAGAYNVALVRLIFDRSQVHDGWARYFCLSQHFQGPIANISRSAQNGFNKEDLRGILVPLPPRGVQIEISDKLDRVFARSKSICGELDRVSQLLERYKQALLATAFQNTGHANIRASELFQWSSGSPSPRRIRSPDHILFMEGTGSTAFMLAFYARALLWLSAVLVRSVGMSVSRLVLPG